MTQLTKRYVSDLDTSIFFSCYLSFINFCFNQFLWESFKRDYRKDYATMDLEKQRFAIFIDNLKLADVRNDAELKNGGTAVHGITKFTDLSQAEFESTFLTADAKLNSGDRDIVKINKVPDLSSGLVDWAGKLTTPVKDQVILIGSNRYLTKFCFFISNVSCL